MEDQHKKQLIEKAADYKRFGFILLSLGIFLFIGLLIPGDGFVIDMPGLFIGTLFTILMLAVVFHRISMKVEKKLFNEDHT